MDTPPPYECDPFIAVIFRGDEDDPTADYLVAFKEKEGRLCFSSYTLCPCQEHWKFGKFLLVPENPIKYIKTLLAVITSRYSLSDEITYSIIMVMNDNGSENVSQWTYETTYSSEFGEFGENVQTRLEALLEGLKD
jgi:hypothetical protein